MSSSPNPTRHYPPVRPRKRNHFTLHFTPRYQWVLPWIDFIFAICLSVLILFSLLISYFDSLSESFSKCYIDRRDSELQQILGERNYYERMKFEASFIILCGFLVATIAWEAWRTRSLRRAVAAMRIAASGQQNSLSRDDSGLRSTAVQSDPVRDGEASPNCDKHASNTFRRKIRFIYHILFHAAFYHVSYLWCYMLKHLLGDTSCSQQNNSVSGHTMLYVYSMLLWYRYPLLGGKYSLAVWCVLSMLVLYDTFFSGYHSMKQMVYGMTLAFFCFNLGQFVLSFDLPKERIRGQRSVDRLSSCADGRKRGPQSRSHTVPSIIFQKGGVLAHFDYCNLSFLLFSLYVLFTMAAVVIGQAHSFHPKWFQPLPVIYSLALWLILAMYERCVYLPSTPCKLTR